MLKPLVVLLLLICALPLYAEPVRVGLLQFGTVNWEVDVIHRHHLDRQQGIELKVIPLASKNALSVALQGGAVDVIVSDWIWVNRQRADGRLYTFFPYSLTVGGLYVRPESGIDTPEGLRGGKLGIAGGPVDKSWLLLQAYARQQRLNLAQELEPVFAAPPLLNRLMLKGELPAVLNFWHYGARLEAAGMQPLLNVKQMLSELGVDEPVPMLGWVFAEDWARQHPDAVAGLLRASYAAKRMLERDDEQWQALRDLTKAENETTLQRLRDGYRRGIPRGLKANGQAVAARVFDILAREGGSRLVGRSTGLSPGTFWAGLDSAELLANDAER